jgi:LuxR family maltose regulon positive regulatory protein
LLNELWSLDTVLVLVLNDYHQVTAADCHESLVFLLRRLPSTLRLVIGTRVDPPLGLARLRARAEMADVRMSDLRFTDAEATTFLTKQLGLPLTGLDVQRIVELTEGWPAGLYLGALSLRERVDAGAFIAEFAGSNRHIVDYLASEVLQRLTDKERTFCCGPRYWTALRTCCARQLRWNRTPLDCWRRARAAQSVSHSTGWSTAVVPLPPPLPGTATAPTGVA